MSRFILRFSLVITLFFAIANSALSHDFTSPEQAVNSYITAVKTGSGKHIEMAFTETAYIQYYDDLGNYHNYTRDDFLSIVDKSGDWDAGIEITEMKVTGKAANATVEFSWESKGKKHGYVDYLNLIHDGKSWHIANKVAQYVPR